MVEDKVTVQLRAAARCVTSRVGPGPFRGYDISKTAHYTLDIYSVNSAR